MAVIPVEALLPKGSVPRFALFQLGFRPFFLGAGLSAITLMALWIYSYANGLTLQSHYGAYGWHSHEMLFGYAAAVVAGFLLTAVRNWTGINTITGHPLALLAITWLAARLLHFFPQTIPAALIALPDILFPVLLTVAIAWPLIRARHTKSYLFIALLALFATGNIAIHAELLGGFPDGRRIGLSLAIYPALLILSVMGGRVIPFFTERPLGIQTRQWPWVEHASLGIVFAMMAVELLLPGHATIHVLALAAAMIHGIRLGGWYHHGIWSHPLLWVLHLGYGWIVIGFLLTAAAATGLTSTITSLHGYTTGGIGVITLGMMARVSLGHTGRMLATSHWMAVAFALLNLAALARLLPYILAPQYPVAWLSLSGLLWIAGFLIFAVIYAPILTKPRVDGLPG